MYQFHIWRYENWRLSDDFNQNDYCKSFDFSHFHGQKKRDKSGFEDKSGCHKSEYALYLVCTSSRKSLFNELSVFSFFSN